MEEVRKTWETLERGSVIVAVPVVHSNRQKSMKKQAGNLLWDSRPAAARNRAPERVCMRRTLYLLNGLGDRSSCLITAGHGPSEEGAAQIDIAFQSAYGFAGCVQTVHRVLGGIENLHLLIDMETA